MMVLIDLGNIHSALGNNDLAVSYFNMGIQKGGMVNSPRFLGRAHTAIAKHYFKVNNTDSALVHAKEAIGILQNSNYSNMAFNSAKLLSEIYSKTNSDSPLKYLRIYNAANDSMYSVKNIQQMQLLTFENELKQQEAEAEKQALRQQRHFNIQFGLIGIGIITFLTVFLILSRGVITNTRLISFLGVVALLLVFEFINLLLHPFLEKVTNHSPLLMLLAMVGIAAMLVPLHHRATRWATSKLVEKNKQIRLAAAKRTIEKLRHDNESGLPTL